MNRNKFRGALRKTATRERSEVIFEVGAEGGSLTILGERNSMGDWQFLNERNEVAFEYLLSEEDRDGFVAFERSRYLSSFDEALKLWDRYQWFCLSPRKVHPDFLDRVLLEVTQRGGESECTRWRERLEWLASIN